MKKLKTLYRYLSLNFLFSNTNKTDVLRVQKIYSKSKHIKIRLFCKNIFFFTVTLNVITISELHFLYYGLKISYLTVKPLLVTCLVVLFVYFIYKNHKQPTIGILEWLNFIFKKF